MCFPIDFKWQNYTSNNDKQLIFLNRLRYHESFYSRVFFCTSKQKFIYFGSKVKFAYVAGIGQRNGKKKQDLNFDGHQNLIKNGKLYLDSRRSLFKNEIKFFQVEDGHYKGESIKISISSKIMCRGNRPPYLYFYQRSLKVLKKPAVECAKYYIILLWYHL